MLQVMDARSKAVSSIVYMHLASCLHYDVTAVIYLVHIVYRDTTLSILSSYNGIMYVMAIHALSAIAR